MRSIPARAGTAGVRWAGLAACVVVAATALTEASTGSAVAASAPAGTKVVLDSATTADAYPYQPTGGPLIVNVSNRGTTKVDSYTFTLDTTSLKGIADVTSCPEKADHILVCEEGHGLVPRGLDQFQIGLRRAKGALVGASGEIRMTVESHGVRLASRTVKVTVPDVGLVPDRLERTPGAKKVKPGTSMKVTSGFTNYGAAPRDTTVVTMNYEGLTPDEEFSNCEYSTYGDARHGAGLVRCEVKGPVDVNGSYDLDLGSVTADTAVLNGHFGISYGGTFQWGSNQPHHRGSGGELKLTPRPASAPPAKPQDIEATIAFDVDNTADIQAVGTTVQQKKAGDLVKATVGVRNKGPAGMAAWLGSDLGEDPPYETRVYLPAGTEAVTAPKGCVRFAPRKGAVYYLCFQDTHDAWIDPGQYTTWTFDLRVVDPAALKPGTIKVTSLSTDPDASNNTAAIVVHAPGHASGHAPGHGSSAGGKATDGKATDGKANGSGGTAGSSGTGGGAMADTGTSPVVPLAAGASALAVVLGGALFLGFRRRRRG
ncbi:hypothetical protein [Streptomyces sp. NPDC007205]|uniref:hypothetical protein n=1 Tax=Streptomyces sp. NPDC007205 TaxID=3154316 RepID=UPI0033E33E7C